MKNIDLFNRVYDGESLCDLERDIVECFDHRFNRLLKYIPQDEHGFQTGYFQVTINWRED